jgi:hypothetical protein
MGAIVSALPYIFGRLAILMLGTHFLFIPGLLLLTFAAILQAATAGAVKAVRMTTSLTETIHPEIESTPAGVSNCQPIG